MSFPEVCERWLAGTTRPERERYVVVLEVHRGAPVGVARSALVAADLGASEEVLDELALVVSASPVFDVHADGSGNVRFSDGTRFGFKKLSRFGGSAKFSLPTAPGLGARLACSVRESVSVLRATVGLRTPLGGRRAATRALAGPTLERRRHRPEGDGLFEQLGTPTARSLMVIGG